MRVLLISANTETISMPILPIGLGSVAASARNHGHEAKMLDLLRVTEPETLVREALRGFEPQLIGISVRNIDDQRMENPRFLVEQVREVVSQCRSLSDAPIVLGGPGYSIFPESTLEYLGADMGIQGEGEHAFPLLLSCMEKRWDLAGVPGLHMSGQGVAPAVRYEKNLDLFSFPEPSYWPVSSCGDPSVWVPLQSKRGCPLDCHYCSTSSIEGRLIRRRSPEGLVEVVSRYREAGFTRFQFVDNMFNLPPSHAKALCRSLIDRGLDISWRAIIYPGRLTSPLVQEMRKAGCVEVSLGFESGSDKILLSMNKRFRREEVRQASEMLAEQGIRQMGFLLLGGPGETRGTVEESLAFVDSLKMNSVRVTAGIRIYPHTSLAETARRCGLIGPHDTLFYPRFYLERGLEGWINESLRAWASGRAGCIL